MSSRLGRTHAGPLVLLFILISAIPLAAQQVGAVAGTIEDEATGTPLGTVLVEVVRADGTTSGGTLSTAIGTFRIENVPAGTYTVRFSLAGWESREQPNVNVSAGRTSTVTMQMVERVYNLNPITVTASKKEEKVLDAPSAIEVVSTTEIEEKPAITTIDYVVDLPGVDLIKTGLQGNYVTTRGFNNIFSGAALVLTDNRIARVPSLRANISHLQPTTSMDLDRIEVVLGPGSALYGPNASNGVIHNITKSPIDDPGVDLAVTGGLRRQGEVRGFPDISGACSNQGSPSTCGTFVGEGRLAHKASEQFGVKLSGRYLTGDDWYFDDPVEAEQQNIANACLASGPDLTNPACLNFSNGLDLSDPADQQTLVTSVDNVAAGRDYQLRSWALDLRGDVRPTNESSLIISGGINNANNSIDLTGIGAAQVQDWRYYYGQVRYSWRDLFAQVFYNRSHNDESYLLRSGRPLIDKSSLFGGQLQYSSNASDTWNLVYGADLLITVPRTDSTINGINENDDNNTEVGGYIQSTSLLGAKTDLVAAIRLDYSKLIDELVFSPRVGVVHRLDEEQTVRLTYNRSFSTPTTLNFFLDISAQGVPLRFPDGTFFLPNPVTGPFVYDLRAEGVTKDGLQFSRTNGVPDHRSPFNTVNPLNPMDPFGSGGSPTELLPTTTDQLWIEAVGFLLSQQLIDPQTAAFLASQPPTQGVGVGVALLDPETASFVPVAGGLAAITDIPSLDPTITNTFEFGYKGLLEDKVLLAGNVWVSIIQDFISALRVVTPNVFLAGDIQGHLESLGVPPAQAAQLAAGISSVPLGAVSPTRIGGTQSQLAVTYQNLGDVTLWGGELSGTYLVTPVWEVNFGASFVNKDEFTTEKGGIEEVVPLNAPKFKGSVGFGYRNPEIGFNGSTQVVYRDGFPANSGVYVGEVNDFATWDILLGYTFRNTGLTFNFQIQNVLDTGVKTFPGTPQLGRLTTLQAMYRLP